MILGMDWLSQHQVMVDCRIKGVTLRKSNEDEVTFISERLNHLSNVISATNVRKLEQKGCEALMSKKLIEFLVHFSDFYYNVIACFYAEICTIYQIYILQKFIVEMKIPARIRSESSSMAKVRLRPEVILH